MAFLRSKTVRGERYVYLVRSVWDPARKSSRQEILRYLGRAGDVTVEDVPEEYRNGRTAEFLASAAGPGQGPDRTAESLLAALLDGDVEAAATAYRGYGGGLGRFYEAVLRPAMSEVGRLWVAGRLGIGVEHVCSNTAISLAGRLTPRPRGGGTRVMVCSPEGEEHCIGCHVITSYLVSRGFDVRNIAPSVPAQAAADDAADWRPAVVLVSVTLEDNVRAARRLVEMVSGAGVPVVVGGRAAAGAWPGCTVHGGSLAGLARLLSGMSRR
ncbi:putative Response regulator receiver domain-containing protein [Nitrosopumilaceae archaeon]|nr:cobalamin-dependent protein [Nitrosopumilus sp.]CAI9830877.1 putative Response regulator receiver domain-containing protein [Nitrosopumilaceae archaeon]MDA7945314.1 cobalamin-dependent protein [Nitrosopumilus sp.]MDA7955290.1 cobalamin-dependent protein [Nitrosopumilus sp.]MDA7974232.1 cobalamin-dependent protein [Nitrosopumilus sp.]